MADQSHQLVQKLWNYCNILRDDLSAPDCERLSGRCGHAQGGGLSYLLAHGLSASPAQVSAQASGDDPSAWSILGVAEGIRTGTERLTFLLLPKAADEKTRSAWKTFPKGAKYI